MSNAAGTTQQGMFMEVRYLPLLPIYTCSDGCGLERQRRHDGRPDL